MTYRSGIVTGSICTLLVLLAIWRFTNLDSASATKPAADPPAKVAKLLKEESINTIELGAEAVKRLALRTAPVERKAVRRVRVYGGEITLPPGQSIIVSSPLNGTLRLPPDEVARPGSAVKNGQVLLQLLPLLSPEASANLAAAKSEAEGQVKASETQRNAAKVAVDRARQLFVSEAGSRRTLDEAQAELELRTRALAAATARHEVLAKAVGDIDSGTASAIDIKAPVEGLLRNINALPGQTVPSGATLFEIVNLDRVWIKVPVYVGDLPRIDVSADAAIGELAAGSGASGRSARPTVAPPSADAASGTVDLYYELTGTDSAYRPGQRVSATLPLTDEAESLTAPWEAIVYDIHGGTWVYERTSERTFVRRRVTVRFVSGDMAVLASGPPAGAQVVTAGAAELFGTETGFSK